MRRKTTVISVSTCAATPLHLADPPLCRLIVHRGLIRALGLGSDGLPPSTDVKQLAEIGAQISATERRAMLAERETKDRLIAHFLSDRIGATFEARISGVTRAGLFVKLNETGADGFVPARTIGNDISASTRPPAPWSARAPARPTGSAMQPPSSWWKPPLLQARCVLSLCPKGEWTAAPPDP